MTPRCAVVQMCSGTEVDANLKIAARRIAEAAADGASLVALPENFALMPASANALLACGRDRADDIDAFLAAQAAAHDVVLVAGSYPVTSADESRVYGTCGVYDGAAGRVARYRKMHLFDVVVSDTESYRESDYTAHGEDVVVADTRVGRIGLSICYDMRFPELYRRLVDDGAVILTMPSAFTVSTGRAHWELLLRARAVENQCFVLAPAQVGEHQSGRRTYGHSLLVDPWGEVLGCLPEGEGVCSATMDFERLAAVRATLPALDHRRL